MLGSRIFVPTDKKKSPIIHQSVRYKILQSITKQYKVDNNDTRKMAENCGFLKNCEFCEIRVATPTGFEPVLPA